ncbi:hypothetical protein FACUT_2235 [Fusarium acutatum]|uniref:Uncharacterized protein n=1 Tax=Fusarium acutatum TaxID=78861 RepID=A0A8H4NYC5_9HYPO|nr:hypothetical protein FACUT_2235 [Fusarium acutatum]
MAAALYSVMTITGPDGEPQPVSLFFPPPTATDLASALNFFIPEDDISSVPVADKKPMTIKDILANIRRKVEADIELNKERRRAVFWDKKKKRIPTNGLVAGGLIKKMN